MKKAKCSHCHGTGKVTCSHCKGRGRIKCPVCDGSGHACPVCSKEYGFFHHPGRVEDEFHSIVYCPNCHGDFSNKKYTCWRCGGEGVIDCSKTERCSVCGGTGKVTKVSDKNCRMFLALGMIGGLLGLHYAYIRRWMLFTIQFALFVILVALVFGSGIVSETVGIAPSVLSKVKWCTYALALIHWLVGMAIIKQDGRREKLNEEFKQGWLWLFFLFFGFTGAHLAYGNSLLIIVHVGYLIFRSLVMINWGWGDKFILSGQIILVEGTILATVEFFIAAILSAFFNKGGFLKEGNELGRFK